MGFLGKVFGTDGAYKEARRDLEKSKDLEMNYYRGLASQDFLQSSENQSALKAARDLLSENTKRIQAQAAVSGATPESVALQKQAANQSLENITTGIASNATASKNSAMENYINANRHYTNAIAQNRVQQAQAESQALSGLLEAGIGAASTFMAPIPK